MAAGARGCELRSVAIAETDAGVGAGAKIDAFESAGAGKTTLPLPSSFTAGRAGAASAGAVVAAAAAVEGLVAAPFDCDFETVAATDFAVVAAAGVGAAAAGGGDFECITTQPVTSDHQIITSDHLYIVRAISAAKTGIPSACGGTANIAFTLGHRWNWEHQSSIVIANDSSVLLSSQYPSSNEPSTNNKTTKRRRWGSAKFQKILNRKKRTQ